MSARQKKIVKDIVGKHGGIRIGNGPGVLYDQKKYDTG
jgi:alkyldihydroxyacetonephosphate synthase